MANHDVSKVKKKRKWRLFKKNVTTLATRKRSRNIQLTLLADFLANRISGSGFSHVVNSPSPFRRKLWAVVIVITTISMIFMTYRVIQEYLEYPTIIRSKLKILSELEFPAVTVCSMSTQEKDSHSRAEKMKDILNHLPTYKFPEEDRTRCLKDPFCHWIWSLDFCKCNRNPCQTSYCYKNISEDKCECSEDMCWWEGSVDACDMATDDNSMRKCTCSTNFTYPLANEDPKFDRLFTGYGVNATMSMMGHISRVFTDEREFYGVSRQPWHVDAEISKHGLPMDSIILWCSFAGYRCSDFETLYTTLGKCYMFNYVGEKTTKPKKVETVWLPGKQQGLTLFMRSTSKDLVTIYAREIGVRIFLHDPRSLPVVQQDGIDLRPGDMSAVSIEYKEIHRLGSPWGKCGQDGQKVGVYCQDPYKQHDCQHTCISAEVFRQCSCYPSEFAGSATIPHEGRFCSGLIEHLPMCYVSYKSLKTMNCSCPPACREKLYPLSLSSSKLNEDYFKLVKEILSLRKVNGTAAITRSDFESSMLGAQIFYNSMIVTHLNETPIYSWESLVSNVGGNMGLFLGISLITFLEAFEFLVDTIRNAFPTRKKLPSRITPVIISQIQNTEENLKA